MKISINKGLKGLIMAALLSSTALCVQAIPIVKLDVLDQSIITGETFLVDVLVPYLGADEVLAFGFDVVVSSPGIIFNGAVVGTDFFDDSALFSDTDVAGSAFPGVTGDNIILANLSFTALAEGSYLIGVVSDFLDVNEGLFTWLEDPLDIAAYTIVSVPEPAVILLMIFGLLGVYTLRISKF